MDADQQYEIETLGGYCPVQGDGWVGAEHYPWYFRARGQAWRLNIAYLPGGNVDDAVGVGFPDGPEGYTVTEDWGDEPFEAGWMDHAIAEGIIREQLARWLVQHREHDDDRAT